MLAFGAGEVDAGESVFAWEAFGERVFVASREPPDSEELEDEDDSDEWDDELIEEDE